MWQTWGCPSQSCFGKPLSGAKGVSSGPVKVTSSALFRHFQAISDNLLARLSSDFRRLSGQGRCRRGRSEIPHFCSKLQSFPCPLGEDQKSEEKRRKKK